jgi:glyoxylase-like metal-dependent hydrolase (beta-lactamase superfamily II)
MKTEIKSLNQVLQDQPKLDPQWDLKIVQHWDNLTYLAINHTHREAIWVDPVVEDWETLVSESKKLDGYRWVAVIDSHTHADHLSNAGQLAQYLSCPLIMHKNAPSQNVDLRVSKDCALNTASGQLHLLVTPGHTWDGITPAWGPFLFGGDTILYGDTGRDDLPTGNPTEHFESLVKIKAFVRTQKSTLLLLPGHDAEGRASSWEHQLKVNASLTQPREDFIRDATAYVGPAPKLLKESLFYNFK